MAEAQGLTSLTLGELAKMDGARLDVAFSQALRRIGEDMDDRPGDTRPRKIVLEAVFIPGVAEAGFLDGAKMQAQIKESLPARKSKVYDLGVKSGGIMVFQPMTPDNHLQQPLPIEEDDL